MNIKSYLKNKWPIAATLLAIGIAMWVLNALTPEWHDDYTYKFMFVENNFDIHHPITSFYQIIISQYNHYFGLNGRSVVHVIAQLFSGICGKDIYNIFNAIVFAVFILLLTRFMSKVSVLNIILSSSLVLLLYPAFNETVLWMTGSINYLWTSVLICGFLQLYEQLNGKTLHIKHFIWVIPCILIAWTHEGLTFPLAISLIIYAILNFKTIKRNATLPLIIGFVIGALLCSMTPATLGRASADDGISIQLLTQKLLSGITVCAKLRAFYVLIFAVILLCLITKTDKITVLKNLYKRNIIICNAILFSFGIVFLSGFTAVRVAIGVELYSMILLIRIMNTIDIRGSKYYKSIICVIGGGLWACVALYSAANYREYKNLRSQIDSRKTNQIIYDEVDVPDFINSYIVRPLDDSKDDYADWFCYNSYWNQYMSATFGYDNLVFLPSLIYNDIQTGNERVYDIAKQNCYPFYVLPLPENANESEPIFILKSIDLNSLPLYIRPFASRMARYTALEMPATQRCDIVEINNRSYMFIGKNSMFDNRVKDIILR